MTLTEHFYCLIAMTYMSKDLGSYNKKPSIFSCVADPVIFFGSGSADPVFKIRIRIRIWVTQKERIPPDPDPT